MVRPYHRVCQDALRKTLRRKRARRLNVHRIRGLGEAKKQRNKNFSRVNLESRVFQDIAPMKGIASACAFAGGREFSRRLAVGATFFRHSSRLATLYRRQR